MMTTKTTPRTEWIDDLSDAEYALAVSGGLLAVTTEHRTDAEYVAWCDTCETRGQMRPARRRLTAAQLAALMHVPAETGCRHAARDDSGVCLRCGQ